MSGPRTIRRKSIFEGRVVDLSIEHIELPGGGRTELELIRHPGAAAIVPVGADNEVYLVRQYRHATGGWLLEVPAGKLEPGEGPPASAAREVQEEIGMRAARWDALGWIWTTPGFTDEQIHLFLARDLEPTSQNLQADEVLTVVSLPLEAAIEKVHAGEIRDSKSICALLRCDRWLRDERRV